jgi:hypothetical protein
MMITRFMLPLVLALLWPLGPTLAQTPPTRVRGTIAAVDGATLSVTSRDGQALRITLVEPLTVATLKRVTLASVVPGTFIGTAAQPGPDGELQAIEVLVFPEAMRGTGEGHYAWDLAPGTTMTNANIEAVVDGNAGRDLTLAYKGGSVKVRVPPDVPVVTPSPATRDDLKPGATVFFAATRAADGSLSTSRVTVSKDGVAPPM